MEKKEEKKVEYKAQSKTEKKVVKGKKIEPQLKVKKANKTMTPATAGEVLGLNTRMIFVVKKMFNSSETKTLSQWEFDFKNERII